VRDQQTTVVAETQAASPYGMDTQLNALHKLWCNAYRGNEDFQISGFTALRWRRS
jgi:hypothetical protein